MLQCILRNVQDDSIFSPSYFKKLTRNKKKEEWMKKQDVWIEHSEAVEDIISEY